MLILQLNGHCIETSAKRKYEELLSYLLTQEDEEKERELEFLVEFLETVDFSELRRRGFDSREKIKVVIKKEGEKFVVEKLS